MKRIVVLLLASACCAAPTAAQIVAPCYDTHIVASPLHPSSSERIGLSVYSTPLFGAARSILASATVQNGIITLDVISTDDPTAFPGYHQIAPFALHDVQAYVGSLQAGTYLVRAQVREFVNGATQPGCDVPDATVTVSATPGAVQLAQAVEFYDARLDRYFITVSSEIVDLDTGVHPGWMRTGEFLHVYLPGESDNRGSPVCRLYAPALELHFLSNDLLECASGDPWISETDDAFELLLPDSLTGTCPANTIPVYRLWNPRTGDHRYTTSALLRASLEQQGWIPEGKGPFVVAMCALP